MATTWVEALKDHIVANDLGDFGSGANDLFIGIMDDGDDVGSPTVALARYGSDPAIQTGAPGTAVRKPSLQVSTRGSYLEAEKRVEDIRDLLELITNQDIQGIHFLRVEPKGDVQYLDTDKSLRHQFIQKFDVSL